MSRRAARATWVAVAALVILPGGLRADGDAKNGEALYQKYCSQCHGATGMADGPAAQFVYPRPRIFKDNSSYKFRTTPSGELPTDADLLRVIANGIPGTSMPAFESLSKGERSDLVAFVKSLNADFADPTLTAAAVPVPELASAKVVPMSPESIERGKKIYQDNKCWQCHGQQGRGDGPSWAELKDQWKNPIVPADLTQPLRFRGGSEPLDIFRAMTTGLNGTPMPAFSDSLKVEERWDLSNYVRSLGPPAGRPRDELVVAVRRTALPATADDEAWKDAPRAYFDTFANVVEAPRLYWPSVEIVSVQAAYTDSELALRIQWDDRSQSTGTDLQEGPGATQYKDRDGAIYMTTQHPDQLAVQFPAKADKDGKRPYFLFGDGKRAVNLWWWRSNDGSLREIEAKGAGSIGAQPTEAQQVKGEVTFSDGQYTMIVHRALTTADRNDVQFAPGAFVPITLHAWDGSRGEVGNRGAMTNWRWLYLEPPVPRTRLFATALISGLATFGILLLVVWMTRSAARRELAPAA